MKDMKWEKVGECEGARIYPTDAKFMKLWNLTSELKSASGQPKVG